MTSMHDETELVPFRTQLLAESDEMGVPLSDDQAQLLLRHLELVIEKNQQLNLTRIVDWQDGVTKHLVDSLLFCRVYRAIELPPGRFLDLGTGAGFPGIPFGVVTGMKGMLIDSVGKKVSAVQDFIEDLGLGRQLSTGTIRAEELARQQRASFICVTARAVAELNVLIEYAAPLLSKHGVLIASKARVSDDEAANASYAAQVCGMELVSRETFVLPHDAGHRELYIYQKQRKPSITLPRKTGMAKHKPLLPSNRG